MIPIEDVMLSVENKGWHCVPAKCHGKTDALPLYRVFAYSYDGRYMLDVYIRKADGTLHYVDVCPVCDSGSGWYYWPKRNIPAPEEVEAAFARGDHLVDEILDILYGLDLNEKIRHVMVNGFPWHSEGDVSLQTLARLIARKEHVRFIIKNDEYAFANGEFVRHDEVSDEVSDEQ